MSSWNGTSRSNYFRVKDVDAFKAWAEGTDLRVLEDLGDMFGIAPSDYSEDGSWPSYRSVAPDNDEDSDDEQEVDLVVELRHHLADGEVCVLMSAGAEKLRYITGNAVAFDNSDKPCVTLSLDDIYSLALAAFGKRPTDASY